MLGDQYNFSHSFEKYCETCAVMICKKPDKKRTDTGIQRWPQTWLHGRWRWKLNCWAREKWGFLFRIMLETSLISVVITFAKKHAAEMWQHKVVRYYRGKIILKMRWIIEIGWKVTVQKCVLEIINKKFFFRHLSGNKRRAKNWLWQLIIAPLNKVIQSLKKKLYAIPEHNK